MQFIKHLYFVFKIRILNINLLKIKYNNYLPYKYVLFAIFKLVKTNMWLVKNNTYTKKDTGYYIQLVIINPMSFILMSIPLIEDHLLR